MLADRNGVPFPPIRRLGPDDHQHCVALSVDRGWSPEEAKWSLLLEETEVFGVDAPDGGLAGSVVLADRNGVPFPPIRRLRPDDHQHCVALSVDRGWSPEEAKWSLLLEETEVFGVDAPDGGLAGSVVLARYGQDLASVGMMLVAGRYSRRGLGSALMSHLLARAGEATVTLYATDVGRPLYAKLGFRPVRKSAAFVGTFRQSAAANGKYRGSRPAAAADMPAILDLDKAAFGADRGYLLRRLPAFAERLQVLETADGITGFAAAWRNGAQAIIGPVVAASGADARRLITDLAAQVRGPVRLDLDPDRAELPEWVLNRGLAPVSRTTVMAYGELARRGDPCRLFTPISVALALTACGVTG